MANPSDLILGVLFKANEDPNFKRIVRRLNSIVTEFAKGMDKVDKAQRKLSQTTKDLSSAQRKLGKDMGKTKDVVDSTNKQIGKITKGIDRLIAAFKVVAVYTVAGRVFQGFQTAVKAGVKEIIDFDQALANLKAITGATDQEIQGMRDTLKETALRTKFSTTEIAEGMVLLGQAGLSGAESIQAIDAVADLAAGTLSDFKNVSDLVTTTLRAFNLEASETRRITDVMANAVNKSKLSIDKLRTAFNYVGAGAAQAGLSLEQTASSMMILANNGLRASTIGTGLRQVLSRLLAPNAKLREAMARYGLELDKATGKSDWFQDQIAKLATVMYNFETNTVDMSRAYQLFGLRGAQAAAILVNSFMDLNGTWEVMLEQASNVGSSSEMMQRQAEGLGFKIKNLADSFGVLAIQLGEAGLATVMRSVVDIMRDMLKYAGQLVDTAGGKLIATFIGVAGALYTVRLAFLAVNTQLLAATARAEKFRAALNLFFLSPVGRAIILVSLLAGSVAYWIHQMGEARRQLIKQGQEASKTSGTLNLYLKQLEKVEFGSKEYNNVLERLKQALPDHAADIDEVSGSYEELIKYLRQLREEQEKLAFESTVKVLAGDIRKHFAKAFYSQPMAENPFAVITEAMLKDDPRLKKIISEGAQGIYLHFAKQLEAGRNRKDVNAAILKMFQSKEALEIFRKYPEEWGKMLDKIWAMLDAFEKRRAKQLEKRYKTELEFVRTMMPKWKQYYDQLMAEGKWEEVARFLLAMKKATQKWIDVEQEHTAVMEEEGWKRERIQEVLQKMKLAFFDEELKKYFETEDKKGKKSLTGLASIRKALAGLSKEYKGEFEAAYDKVSATFDDLERRVNDHITDTDEKQQALVTLWIAYYAKIQELAQKYGLPPHMQPEVLKKLNELGAKAKMPKVEQPPGYTRPEEWHGRPRGMSKEEYDAQEIKDQEAEWGAEKERVGREGEEAEQAYRRGEISAEDYFKKLDEMKDHDLLTEKEYNKKKRTETQGLWENMKEGWKDYFGEMQTNGEFIQQFAGDLIEQLSTGFADAWGDFLSGTKDAKEAFADFARDMLRWLAQIMAKRVMQNVMGSLFHGGGMYGEGGAQRRIKGQMFLPKLHDGLMPNEFAAILRKDEAVFTPKQLKALGGMIKGSTEINVPVSVAGGNGDTLKRHLPGEIEQTVLKVMRKYM